MRWQKVQRVVTSGVSLGRTKALNDGSTDIAVLLTEGIVKDIATGGSSKIVGVYVQSSLCWGIHTGAQQVASSLSFRASTALCLVLTRVMPRPGRYQLGGKPAREDLGSEPHDLGLASYGWYADPLLHCFIFSSRSSCCDKGGGV